MPDNDSVNFQKVGALKRLHHLFIQNKRMLLQILALEDAQAGIAPRSDALPDPHPEKKPVWNIVPLQTAEGRPITVTPDPAIVQLTDTEIHANLERLTDTLLTIAAPGKHTGEEEIEALLDETLNQAAVFSVGQGGAGESRARHTQRQMQQQPGPGRKL